MMIMAHKCRQMRELQWSGTPRQEALKILFCLKGGKMKTKRMSLILSTVLLCLVPAFAADISGKWTTSIKTMIGEMNYTFDFKVEGEKLTGKAVMSMGDESSESVLTEGSVKGDEISFVETLKVQGQELRCEYKGKISGDEIRGSRQVGSYGGEEFVAKRAK
jgi:hypothetical protein